MTIFRNNTEQDYPAQPESRYYEPFPPSYYENERRAKALIAQMTTLKDKKKPLA
ncbi:MAG: hypothetical protein AB7V55_07185 [Oscillospiraceae bacterium]